MANLTFKQLKEHLSKMSTERLEDTVTIYLSEEDEYFPVSDIHVNEYDDVLDAGHHYISVTT